MKNSFWANTDRASLRNGQKAHGGTELRLVDESGRPEFQLTIAGYEFPEITDDKWDSNWLMVKIDVRSPEASWSCSAPCLDTLQSRTLAEWLADTAAGRPCEQKIGITEPNLRLEVAGRNENYIDLKITFRAECHPAGMPTAMRSRGFSIPVRVTPAHLEEAAREFSDQLQQFPVRGPGAGAGDSDGAGLPRPQCLDLLDGFTLHGFFRLWLRGGHGRPMSVEPPLTEEEYEELRQVSVSQLLPAGDLLRARVILMLAEGVDYAECLSRLYGMQPALS